ncbi:UNVERIFIED_CONTAM: Quinone oxidoreductase [Sesamum latifolium]|uniref:Quinone oxidoreductase n=1 Tax=Sesamum latifolium TaxID=2727402 RepID=A0AAW2T8F1_9LAMI
MLLPKFKNFHHHHHRFPQNSFAWGSSSLNQLQRALAKTIPSAVKFHNRAAVRPISSSAVVASKMVKAIRVYELGGPEVLKWEDVEIGEPKDGEIKVKNKAIGLNFIDTYFRKGVYKASMFPFTPGMEAVGVVTAVGPGLTGRKVGDLVGYAGNPMGAYAEEQILPADKVVPVPPSIDPS